jgi:hypothetical protein
MSLLQVLEHNNKSHPIVDAIRQKEDKLFQSIVLFTVITARIANCLHDLPFFGYNKRARR